MKLEIRKQHDDIESLISKGMESMGYLMLYEW